MKNERVKLLFVEDNKTDLIMFKRFVKEKGLSYDYVVSDSVSSAKLALEKNAFDIIMTDYDLGDGTAFDLLGSIPKNIPVVIITGTGSEDIAVKVMKKGATDYLTKDPDGYYLKTLPITVEKAIKTKEIELSLKKYQKNLAKMVKEQTKQLHLTVKNLEREIKERKQVVDTLRKSEARYSTLVENALDGILIIQDKKIKFVNRVSINLMHCKSEDLIGMDYIEIIAPEYRKESAKTYLAQQAGKNIMDVTQTAIIRKDNTVVPIEANVTGKIDYNGKPADIVMIKDISLRVKAMLERDKLEAQLYNAQKIEAIGTLAGGIAHDFNNILFPIMGYTEMTMDIVPKDSIAHKNLNKIFNASIRAKALVQQIHTFSRQHDQELRPLSVQIVVKEVLKLIRASLPATIKIQHNIDEDCDPIMADPTRIHQMVLNLCTNAFHAMEESGGTLKVSLNKIEMNTEDMAGLALGAEHHLCLKVEDTGKGMVKTVMDRIFDPYFTTKKPDKGTGLGLAMVHGIIKSCGGDIRVLSEPGKGTVFKVYLPVLKGNQVPSVIIKKEILPTGHEHILLVDDEEMIISLEQQMVESFGYHATIRTSSIEALEAFRAQPYKFDLVITDMTMPNMTGNKLVVELRKIRPDIPVIICTGFSENISKQTADIIGIQGFLLKPIVKKQLATMIREVLDNFGMDKPVNT